MFAVRNNVIDVPSSHLPKENFSRAVEVVPQPTEDPLVPVCGGGLWRRRDLNTPHLSSHREDLGHPLAPSGSGERRADGVAALQHVDIRGVDRRQDVSGQDLARLGLTATSQHLNTRLLHPGD